MAEVRHGPGLVRAAVLWACLALPAVCAADWMAGPEDGELAYTAYYEGSPLPGRFRDYRVMVREGKDGAPAAIDVAVEVGSVTMSAGDIDEAIRAPDWFDVAGFPRASFSAASVLPDGEGGYRARGLFTLKGATREIEVPLTWRQAADTIAMAGRVELKRLDFGIGTGEWSSGDEIGLDVVVEFRLTLRRQP